MAIQRTPLLSSCCQAFPLTNVDVSENALHYFIYKQLSGNFNSSRVALKVSVFVVLSSWSYLLFERINLHIQFEQEKLQYWSKTPVSFFLSTLSPREIQAQEENQDLLVPTVIR